MPFVFDILAALTDGDSYRVQAAHIAPPSLRWVPAADGITAPFTSQASRACPALKMVNGLTPRALADRLGVSAVAVRQWMREKDCSLSAKNLINLAKVLVVRPSWLCNGEGDLFRHKPPEYTEHELLRIYRGLSETGQLSLTDIAAVIAARSKGK